MTPVPDPFDKLRPQNQATWQSHGAPWCAEQMATNWPRNQYGSLLSRYEYEALLAALRGVTERLESHGELVADGMGSAVPVCCRLDARDHAAIRRARSVLK